MWNQLEELLKAKKMSRYKLSKLTGIRQTTLQSYKDGAEPSFKNMIKIADALDVSLDYFRKRDDQMKPTLKLLRVNKGFNQNELGEKIGVSQTTISAWEQGKSKPSARNIYKLAEIYAVEPTVIFNTLFKQKT